MEDALRDEFALSTDSGRFAHLEPELVMPSQYEDLRRSTVRAPELRLMVAVLGDAVRCYHQNLHQSRPRARRIFAETTAWFAAESHEEPFSFVSICAVLDIDPECFRAQILTPFRTRIGRDRLPRAYTVTPHSQSSEAIRGARNAA